MFSPPILRAFLLALLLPIFGALRAENRPNIVFIISDDQAWTDYGFMGHPQIETPHLDALAKRSALFERGYVPTALCRPALATLANGMYAHQHRISGNDPSRLPGMTRFGGKDEVIPDAYQALRGKLIAQIDRYPTMARLLGQHGYLSHQSGKWWEGNFKRGGFTHGMTRGFPEPGGRHGDDGLKIGREGLAPVTDFIDHAVAEKKPFFVWYAPFLPHTPHNPPERLFAKYKAMGIASDFVARYYAMVEWFDETCGQLLAHLDARGLSENTLVVYLADNGWIQKPDGGGYAPRSKQTANEGGIRQPILYSWPGTIQPGRRGPQLASSIDIVPTALAAAGLPAPAHLPGYNLLPALKSGAPTPRHVVYGETFAHDVPSIERPVVSLVYRWVIDGNWKLLLTYDGEVSERYADSNPRDELRPQLFDLLADPHEERNLASTHPEVVARLADLLHQWWPAHERKVQTVWSE